MRMPTYRGIRTNKKVSLVIYPHFCGERRSFTDNWDRHWTLLEEDNPRSSIYNNVKMEPYRYYSQPRMTKGAYHPYLWNTSRPMNLCPRCLTRGCLPLWDGQDLTGVEKRRKHGKSLKKQNKKKVDRDIKSLMYM